MTSLHQRELGSSIRKLMESDPAFRPVAYLSMEIGIKVIAENIRTQEQRHVNSCFFTMVAVDENGKPTAVAPLRPFTPEEKRRHAAAELRKTMRREMEQRYAAIRHDA